MRSNPFPVLELTYYGKLITLRRIHVIWLSLQGSGAANMQRFVTPKSVLHHVTLDFVNFQRSAVEVDHLFREGNIGEDLGEGILG
ncbi:hypothetical protein SAY86_018217 [Trapa natans]|uniref:Uncharacterized protein n=1 Tax=Trapa natans TaxID=22666 RepID=A0AAN7LFW8_TRANT|nr:hypothetical protein SAY86_018217 [Trapa natans]